MSPWAPVKALRFRLSAAASGAAQHSRHLLLLCLTQPPVALCRADACYRRSAAARLCYRAVDRCSTSPPNCRLLPPPAAAAAAAAASPSAAAVLVLCVDAVLGWCASVPACCCACCAAVAACWSQAGLRGASSGDCSTLSALGRSSGLGAISALRGREGSTALTIDKGVTAPDPPWDPGSQHMHAARPHTGSSGTRSAPQRPRRRPPPA